jgi:tRNA(fMet)-specific endonuclease VapC
MGQKSQILVDTNIFIRVFRGDENVRSTFAQIENRAVISVITYLELLAGANTKKRVIALNKEMKHYPVLHLNETISEQALSVAKLYSDKKNLYIPDALIAATALHHNIPLFTYNKKDFDFIKGLSLYEIE